ncbi:putative transcription initiation factor iib [Papiliotrema laurentii]|uniref:Transcription initiation factor IIB n=1 Tax=Papiliotrema laurentii TaxID=5418 RepID=A0AAD9CY29_PAPLA|nr:putative transcription initiation factor iib [Papiliotrema laurentii]
MMTATAGPQTQKFAYGQPAAPNLNVHLLCPRCREDPPNLVEEYSKGDIVCGSCGMVLGDRIVDTRSEWRTFAGDENGDDPSRVGDAVNPLLAESFETTISSINDRNGQARDLQRAAARQQGNKENNALNNVFKKIAEIGEKLQVNRNVVQSAQWAYKIAEDKKYVRGKGSKDTDAAIAACIILGCRRFKVDRSLLEVAQFTGIEKKKIGKMLLALGPVINRELGDKNPMAVASKGEQSTRSLIARYINYLGLDNDVNKAAQYIAERAGDQEGVVGRSPVSIAAGVLYFAVLLYDRADDLEKASAKEIAKIANVSDGTIKHVCKLIAAKISAVIKPEWNTLSGYDRLVALGRSDVANSVKPSRASTPKPDVNTP